MLKNNAVLYVLLTLFLVVFGGFVFLARHNRPARETEPAPPIAVPVPAEAPEPEEPIDLAPDRDVKTPPPPPAKKTPVKSGPIDMTQNQLSLASLAIDNLWLLPGQPILADASKNAPVVRTLDAMAYLPVITAVGEDWVEVVHGEEQGWIDRRWKPSQSRRKARPGRKDKSAVDNGAALDEARQLLGKPQGKLGDYKLYTDVDDEELLAFLDDAAEATEEAFFARYGRLPDGRPDEAVVLFADADAHRQFAQRHVPSRHAGRGVVALTGRSRKHLAVALIHDLAHVLNARAVARDLPPWLEEGLASELSNIWMARSGGAVRRDGEEVALLRRQMKSGGLPPLGELVGANEAAFDGLGAVGATMSGAFVRYLLDGEQGALADGFREYLQNLAAGEKADLLARTGRDAGALSQGFTRWLEAEAGG